MKTKVFTDYAVTANGRPICGFRSLELAKECLHDYEARETGEAILILKHVFSTVDLDYADSPTSES